MKLDFRSKTTTAVSWAAIVISPETKTMFETIRSKPLVIIFNGITTANSARYCYDLSAFKVLLSKQFYVRSALRDSGVRRPKDEEKMQLMPEAICVFSGDKSFFKDLRSPDTQRARRK